MSDLKHHLTKQLESSRSFFWHRVRWAAVSNLLPKDGNFSLIDVGAGAGFAGEFLRETFPGSKYFFIEPIKNLEDRLESTYGADKNLAAAQSYKGMRIVTCLDVIEHIEDDRAAVASIIEKMDVGATLIITVPALQGLWSEWDQLLGHFRRYDKKMLRALFDKLPVEVEEVSYLFLMMVWPALWRKFTKRSKKSSSDAPKVEQSSEFPTLPLWVNDIMTSIGKVALNCRRCNPAGTSVLAVVRKV